MQVHPSARPYLFQANSHPERYLSLLILQKRGHVNTFSRALSPTEVSNFVEYSLAARPRKEWRRKDAQTGD